MPHYTYKLDDLLREQIIKICMNKKLNASMLIRNAMQYILDNQIDLLKLPDPANRGLGRAITFVCPEDLMQQFEDYAIKFRMLRSEAIRRAVSYYVALINRRLEKEEKPIRARIEKMRIWGEQEMKGRYAIHVNDAIKSLIVNIAKSKRITVTQLVYDALEYVQENNIDLSQVLEPPIKRGIHTIAFRYPLELMQMFDEYSKKFKITRSNAIRRAIIYYAELEQQRIEHVKKLPKARIEKLRI